MMFLIGLHLPMTGQLHTVCTSWPTHKTWRLWL